MIRRGLITVALTLHFSSHAAAPSQQGIQSCLHARAQGSVLLETIPFDERTIEPMSGGRSATLTRHLGHLIGYLNQAGRPTLVFDRRTATLANSRLINISPDELKALLLHEQLDLNQPADWIWLEDQSRQRFVCVVLNQSMEKATKLAIFMETMKPHRIYFYAEHR